MQINASKVLYGTFLLWSLNLKKFHFGYYLNINSNVNSNVSYEVPIWCDEGFTPNSLPNHDDLLGS